MGAADTAKLRPLNAAAAAPKAQAASPGQNTSSGATGGAGLRIIKFFAAVALIPACAGLTLGIHDHFVTNWMRLNMSLFGPSALLRWFGAGTACFTLFAVLLWRPIVIYVFGHELIHAIATWMCLGKVSNLTASATGGQVTTSKSNTFIRLAPYCIPFYALMAVAVFAALNTWWQPLNDYTQWLAFSLGFFYAFHVGFTLWSLRRDQPDLKPDGWLFSLVMIYMANAVIFVAVMAFVLDGHFSAVLPAMRDSAREGWQHSWVIYHNLYRSVEHAMR